MKLELRNINPIGTYFLIGLFTCPYLYLLWNYSLNLPHGDDFYALINFFRDLEESQTFGEQVSAFFFTKKEHVNLVTRFIALLELRVFGEMNFRVYTFIGNLYLIGILIILYNYLKEVLIKHPIHFIVVILVILNISYWEISIKGLMAVQHFGVLFFSLLCFKWLSENEKHWILAFLSGLVAMYCFGNGFLSLILGGVILFVQNRKSEFRSWVGLSVIFIAIMAYQLACSYSDDGVASLAFHQKIRFFFNLFGAFLGAKYLYSSFFVGLLVIGTPLFLLWKKGIYKTYPFISAVVLFVILSYVLVTVQRGDRGIEVSFYGRYPVYCSVLLVMIYYLFLVHSRFVQKLFFISLGLAIFVNVNSWFTRWEELNQRKNIMVEGAQNWYCTKQNYWLRDGIDSPYNIGITNQFTWLNESKIYEFPVHLINDNCGNQK